MYCKRTIAEETSHNDVLGGLESVDGMRGFEEAKGEHSLTDDSVDEVAVGETRSSDLSPHWSLESRFRKVWPNLNSIN